MENLLDLILNVVFVVLLWEFGKRAYNTWKAKKNK